MVLVAIQKMGRIAKCLLKMKANMCSCVAMLFHLTPIDRLPRMCPSVGGVVMCKERIESLAVKVMCAGVMHEVI